MAEKSFDKLIDQIGEMSVLELSELVKALEDKFGVSAAMPMAAAPAAVGAAPAAAEEKSEYKVTLKKAGDKIPAIKALRAVRAGLGLTEAKKMVEEAPTVIAEAVPKEEAKKIKEALEAAGSEVELA